jgi:Flp pilus assembly protein protease CpaA
MHAIPWAPIPAAVGLGILMLAAAFQALARRVPNVLTFSGIATGWMFAIFLDATHRSVLPGPMLQASLAGVFVAFLLMLPIYRTKKLGAGCVKAQMAFAAWVSCAIPLVPAITLIACSTFGGLIFTFGIVYLSIADRPDASRRSYESPAQFTMSTVGIVGTLGCCMISNWL